MYPVCEVHNCSETVFCALRFSTLRLKNEECPPLAGGVGGGENFSYINYFSYMDANKSNLHQYNPHLQTFANKLRKEMTKAEACLWKYALRSSMMKGYPFRRQRPVLKYIADFMCNDLMIIIEVDGITTLGRKQL